MFEIWLQIWLAASIEGRLWNPVTGAPVRKADVVVGTTDGRPVKRAISDVNGRYFVDGLAAGRYRVAAGRAGYVPAILAGVVVVQAEEARRDVNLSMEMPAVIEGRVLDGEGEPVEQVKVIALRQEGSKISRAGDGLTNDRGEYRIAGLAAGSYVVRSSATSVGEEQVLAPVFYPAAVEWAGAVSVRVGRGGEAQSINIQVERMPAGSVSGVVQAVADLAGQVVSVQIARQGTDAERSVLLERAIQVVPGDKFVIPKLAPGAYTLEARAEGAGGVAYWAMQDVVVGGAATAEVTLTLVHGLELAAQVEPELPPVRLSLTRVNGVRQEADGKLRFRNLSPGTWELGVNGLEANHFVERVWFGEREVRDGLVQIDAGLLPKLRIVVSNAGSTVQGSANEEGTTVVLKAESAGAGQQVIAGARGEYRMKGVRPGKYRLRCGEVVGELFEVAEKVVMKQDCGS